MGRRQRAAASRGVIRMWHDAWPPQPPDGHRPPDAPPFTSPGDQLLAVGLGAAAGAGILVWATGQAAGLIFGHPWRKQSPADVAHVLWNLPQHWSDPALAWPAQVQGPLPGPAAMYASFTGVVGSLSGGTAAVLRHLPGRAAGHRPGRARSAKHAAAWAGARELRLLTVKELEPGRGILGRTPGAFGRLLAAEDCHSVLVFGPTGSYKTSALVIPAVLEWSGPLVATSVKPDLLRATLAHRGQGLVIDPLGASGVQAARWSPLASCGTWAGAQQTAVQLANAIEQTPTEEQRPEHRFWRPWAPSSSPPCCSPPPARASPWPRSSTGSTAAKTRRSRPSWGPPGCRPRPMRENRRSTAPTEPSTRCMPRPRRSWPSTATSAWPPPPTATTWTWISSLRGTTRSTCTPRPTSSGCFGRCSRRSPSRWWPPPRSGPPFRPTGCFSRGWGCSWMRPATAPPSVTWTCWPPQPGAKASSW